MMMKYIRLIIPCIVLASVFVACSSADKRLEYALSFAGDNRGELEKVLEHYGQEPEKLEAARFLIRNMPHWYAYEGWQLDSVRQMLALRKLDKESIKKWKQVSFYSLPKVYDAQVITSNYLIENIDLAFKVWKKYPWNRSLDFDDFCEFILPYRIDNEPLSSWRKLYYEHYTPILDISLSWRRCGVCLSDGMRRIEETRVVLFYRTYYTTHGWRISVSSSYWLL